MKFWETDLDVCFADFGEPAVFNPNYGIPLEVTVLVDDFESDPNLLGQATANQYHVLTAKTSEVEEIVVGDEVEVFGQMFEIDYLYPDVTGLTKMRLRK